MPEPTNLIEFPSIEPASDVLSQAKRLVELVEQGAVSSFAAALVYKDGHCGHVRSEAASYSTQIGALCRLIHNMNLDLDDV